MRLLIFYVLILVFLAYSCKEPQRQLKATAERIKAIDTIYDYSDSIYNYSKSKWYKVYRFKLQLINLSSDTIKYITMKCDSEYNWIINSSKFNHHRLHDCNANYPTIKKLMPYDTLHFLVEVEPKDECYCMWTPLIRFGYVLIDAKKYPDTNAYWKVLSDRYMQTEVIWTNAIDLKM
jgi:hypothetical protein